MKIAVMQPYLFPYIGYFQLVNAVDKFVFYDDVNFIKKGWINRNQLLVNNVSHLFSIPLINASQNKLIHEIELAYDEKWLNNFYATLKQNYKKAPYFQETFQLIQDLFSTQYDSIANLSIASIESISNHLEISTIFEKSSKQYAASKGMEKANRLIEITKLNRSTAYINPAGGKELYHKEYFKEQGVNLYFIGNQITPYQQYNNTFVGGLSIIDVLMFNTKEEIKQMLTQYRLV